MLCIGKSYDLSSRTIAVNIEKVRLAGCLGADHSYMAKKYVV
jgi:hypothetical protein